LNPSITKSDIGESVRELVGFIGVWNLVAFF
jgi:hypothetical protein